MTDIFSLLCGQGRCFVVDSVALPVCQRCLGLYTGAALTGVWLAASGLWRRGLPGTGVVLLNAAMLATAIVGGTHLVDGGPRWRVMCGLWTGHVVVFWLAAAAVQLWHLYDRARFSNHEEPPASARAASPPPARPMIAHGPPAGREAPRPIPWRAAERGQAPVMAAGLILLAWAFPGLMRLGWYFWTTVATAGAAILALAVLAAMGSAVLWLAAIGLGTA